ncbi:PH domain-containing protein [Salinimicrobium soli]|uniref:PH domain-containing protein n=1 Tax=Salinimicrobium soli TaxID=1254399 RepID=UPI003AAC777C
MDPIAKEEFSNIKLNVASLPAYEEVQLHSLAPKFLWKLNIGTLISALFFLVVLTVAFTFFEPFRPYLWFAAAVWILLFGWSFFSNIQLMKRNGYALREKDVIYKRGFLFEKTTIVPFNRIQHVSVERSFLDKLLNLATLKVYTAGGSGSDVSVPGLFPDNATSLKEEISARISGHA